MEGDRSGHGSEWEMCICEGSDHLSASVIPVALVMGLRSFEHFLLFVSFYTTCTIVKMHISKKKKINKHWHF